MKEIHRDLKHLTFYPSGQMTAYVINFSCILPVTAGTIFVGFVYYNFNTASSTATFFTTFFLHSAIVIEEKEIGSIVKTDLHLFGFINQKLCMGYMTISQIEFFYVYFILFFIFFVQKLPQLQLIESCLVI